MLKTSAHVLHKIGTQHEEHAKRGLEPIVDYLYTYKGLFTNIPDIINVHKVSYKFNYYLNLLNKNK